MSQQFNSPHELPQAMREFLATFEAYRRLGFPAEDIHFAIDQHVSVFAVLEVQGKNFYVSCGRMPKDLRNPDLIRNMYETMITSLPDFPQEDMDEIWQNSFVYHHKVEFMTGLTGKGFRIPKAMKSGLN